MIPLAFKCHTPGYKSIGREHGSSNLIERKGMVAQDIHKHTNQQHKPCQTQHTLFTRGLDHTLSSRAGGVPRLKTMEQCTPAESVLCPYVYKTTEPCHTIQHCSSLSTTPLPSPGPTVCSSAMAGEPAMVPCAAHTPDGEAAREGQNSSVDRVTMQRENVPGGRLDWGRTHPNSSTVPW